MISKKFPEFVATFLEYGGYGKPFLNYYFNHSKDSDWLDYFLILKLVWKREYPKALRKIDRVLKRVRKNKTLTYFLLAEKLALLSRLDIEQAILLYKQLKYDFSQIPKAARNIVATVMINVHAELQSNEDMHEFRTWSKQYLEHNPTRVFLELGIARRKAISGNLDMAKELFLDAFEIARSIPHPGGMSDSLNDSAWYLREYDSEFSLKLAQKCLYIDGQYYEKFNGVINEFDTYHKVLKLTKVECLCENAMILYSIFELIQETAKGYLYKRYEGMLKECLKFIADLEVSSYRSELALIENLRSRISNITAASNKTGIARHRLRGLLNGKTQTVRGETLRKIITGLRIEVDPLNDPYPIVNEWIKLQIDKGFENAITELEKLKPSEREILVLSTYTAFLNRRKDYPYLSRKGTLSRVLELCKENLRRFREFTENRYEMKKFVAQLFELHPFLEGRRDLVRKFLKALPARKRKEFIQKHLQFVDEDRGVIDTFMRNYVRYDKNWGLRLKPPAELYPFTQKYRLKKTQTALAYWALDKKKERKKLANRLLRFI